MIQPHYLRFVRALTLAALVPGCAGTSSPAPAPLETSDAGVGTGPTLADASAPVDAASDDEQVDAHAFSSGPIVPPELPASFA